MAKLSLNRSCRSSLNTVAPGNLAQHDESCYRARPLTRRRAIDFHPATISLFVWFRYFLKYLSEEISQNRQIIHVWKAYTNLNTNHLLWSLVMPMKRDKKLFPRPLSELLYLAWKPNYWVQNNDVTSGARASRLARDLARDICNLTVYGTLSRLDFTWLGLIGQLMMKVE